MCGGVFFCSFSFVCFIPSPSLRSSSTPTPLELCILLYVCHIISSYIMQYLKHHCPLSSSFDQSLHTGAVKLCPLVNRPPQSVPCACLHPCSLSSFSSPQPSSSCPSLSAKQNWLSLGAIIHLHPPPQLLTHWRLGWSQTNSIMADNTATARKRAK